MESISTISEQDVGTFYRFRHGEREKEVTRTKAYRIPSSHLLSDVALKIIFHQ